MPSLEGAGEPGAGRRQINVHSIGNKRDLISDESSPSIFADMGRQQ
jgi:hypothetical protein